jgi:hypothetical protein
MPRRAGASGLLVERLRNQRLVASDCRTAEQVVRHLGAVQSQDYTGAVWAVGLRVPGLVAADVEASFTAGRVLRTHVLRPTWHFVAPADIRWMLALTGPHVQKRMRPYDKPLELDPKVYTRARAAIERALEGGRFLTREELSAVLRRNRIVATGQRLTQLVMHAELEGAICSGPRRGKQSTYALLAERAPAARTLTRDEALAALAQRYFGSHGPATLRDFVWWSGLKVKDAAAAIALASVEVLPAPPAAAVAAGAHYLLPNHDEYLIAYRDRDPVLDPERARNLGFTSSREYPHQLVLDGRVAGSWQRQMTERQGTLVVKSYKPLEKTHLRALEGQVEACGRFFDRPCRLDQRPTTND